MSLAKAGAATAMRSAQTSFFMTGEPRGKTAKEKAEPEGPASLVGSCKRLSFGRLSGVVGAGRLGLGALPARNVTLERAALGDAGGLTGAAAQVIELGA